MTHSNILEIRDLTKQFPGVKALDKVDLDIATGEVHVLVGENGAGKSTTVKILCGLYQPDKGEILYEGHPYKPQSTQAAMRAGIRIIYQELNLLSHLSVAENIFLERIPRRFGLVDRRILFWNTEALLAEVGLNVSPDVPVERLGVAQKQQVEIARALSNDSKVLIMDEPTSTLSPREIGTLFTIIESLKQKGVTIIYISHRLQEIFEIGDRVTVLRNGRKVATCLLSEMTIPDIVKMMVGRDMAEEYPFRPEVEPAEEVLRVQNLRVKGNPIPVDFSVRRGEILGVAGLVGSGRTEMMRALFGADGRVKGQITVNGEPIAIRNPKTAIKHGICLLTEDRKEQGLVLDMSCCANITLTNLRGISRAGLLRQDTERRVSKTMIDDLTIRTPSVGQLAKNLSGGNQQKLVIAKWLYKNTEVFIFDEPTRGIDVGAKYEIYNLLWDLAAVGKAIIMISSDLPELMGVCHRIMVLSKGVLTGEVMRDEYDQEHILSLAYQEYISGRANGHAAQS